MKKIRKYVLITISILLLVITIVQCGVIHQVEEENDNLFKAEIDLHYHLVRTASGLSQVDIIDPDPVFEVVNALLKTLKNSMEDNDLYTSTLYRYKIEELYEESTSILHFIKSDEYSFTQKEKLEHFSQNISELFNEMRDDIRLQKNDSNKKTWIKFINEPR